MSKWYTGRQVISEALFLLGDIEQKRFEEGVVHFAREMRNYQLFHKIAFKKVWLPVTAIQTVTLPDDFMDIIFVGTFVNGELFTFTRNQRIISPADPLEKTLTHARGEDQRLLVVPLEGCAAKGVNQFEYFSVNLERNRIELRKTFLDFYENTPVSEVYLGYIANDVTDLNTALIPLEAVNMITNNIAYQMSINTDKPFVVQTRKYEADKATLNFDALRLPTADELLDAIYETSGQSIRR